MQTADARTAQFCLKEHRCDQIARIEFELGFSSLMEQAGFPLIPNVVPTVSGKLVAIGEEHKCYSLTEFIQADKAFNWTESTWNREHNYAAGLTLCDFHQHSRISVDMLMTNEQRLNLPNMAPPLGSELLSQFEAALRTAAGAFDGTNGSKLDEDELLPLRLALDNADDLLNRVRRAIALLPTVRDVPGLLVHGDYHPGNLLFRNTEVKALLDMDYLQLGSPFYDLGYGALLFSGLSQQQPEVIEMSMVKSFIEGYNEQALRSSRKPHSLEIPATVNDLQPWLTLAALVVAYWLLDVYAKHPEERKRIREPLINSLRLALAAA